jgi:PPM family protein phosphatase
LAANESVLAFARAKGCEGSVAATVVAAVIRRGELFWIGSGDSRGYILRRGGIFRLTVDHTYGEDRLLSGIAGAMRDEPLEAVDPEAVSSFMGFPGTPRTDGNRRPFRLAPDDCVLLASDGLYRSLNESAIAALMTGDLRRDCDSLAEQVLKNCVEDQDNVTVLAMKCHQRDVDSSVQSWRLPRAFGRKG